MECKLDFECYASGIGGDTVRLCGVKCMQTSLTHTHTHTNINTEFGRKICTIQGVSKEYGSFTYRIRDQTLP